MFRVLIGNLDLKAIILGALKKIWEMPIGTIVLKIKYCCGEVLSG